MARIFSSLFIRGGWHAYEIDRLLDELIQELADVCRDAARRGSCVGDAALRTVS